MKSISNIAYGPLSERDHLLDIYLPEGKTGFQTFLYFHGGGIESGNKNGAGCPDCQKLTDAGYAVVKANYRLYPNAKYPEFLEDAALAAAWVLEHIAEYGGNGDVIVGGSSAGGYLSMMICFDPRYLTAFGHSPKELAGWVFDAGQPTTHFNVLEKDRGIDHRALIVDEAAPLYYVRQYDGLAPMLIFAAEHDMPCRLEQTQVLLKTLSWFGYPEENITFEYMPGFKHCEYNGAPCFTDKILAFLEAHQK